MFEMYRRPNSDVAATTLRFGSCQTLVDSGLSAAQLPNQSVAAARPECGSCQTTKPDFGGCQTRAWQLPHPILATAQLNDIYTYIYIYTYNIISCYCVSPYCGGTDLTALQFRDPTQRDCLINCNPQHPAIPNIPTQSGVENRRLDHPAQPNLEKSEVVSTRNWNQRCRSVRIFLFFRQLKLTNALYRINKCSNRNESSRWW